MECILPPDPTAVAISESRIFLLPKFTCLTHQFTQVLLKCHLLRELFSASLCLHHHPNLVPPISSHSRSSAGNSSLPGVKSIWVFACLSIACLLYSALEPKFQKGQECCLAQHYIPSVNKNKNWHIIAQINICLWIGEYTEILSKIAFVENI